MAKNVAAGGRLLTHLLGASPRTEAALFHDPWQHGQRLEQVELAFARRRAFEADFLVTKNKFFVLGKLADSLDAIHSIWGLEHKRNRRVSDMVSAQA